MLDLEILYLHMEISLFFIYDIWWKEPIQFQIIN